MDREKRNLVKDRSYSFALSIIGTCRILRKDHEFVLERQILCSGTSIGANVEEALAGQSRKDFISKMAIASKEARETSYWLRLVRDSKTMNSARISPLIAECEALIRILTAIVKTSTSNGPKES